MGNHLVSGRFRALIEVPLGARYGLEAAAWLARRPSEEFHRVGDIAARLSLPGQFLAKIFRRLLRAGLLDARRGPGGGYRLALPARDVSVVDVLDAAGGCAPDKERACLLHPRACGEAPCTTHAAVLEAEEKVRVVLAGISLSDLDAPDERVAARVGGASRLAQVTALAFALGFIGCQRGELETYRVAKQPAAAAAAPHDHDHAHDHDHQHQPGHKHEPEPMPAGAGKRAPEAGPGAGAAASEQGPGLAWKAPEGFKPKAAEGMRFASYAVATPKGEADLSVIVLEGEAGGTLPNVNRWRGQLGLPAIDEAALKKAAQTVRSAAGALLVVELAAADGGAGMIAAMLPKDGKTWFFKLTGPSGATSAAKPSLLRFLGSLR